MPFSWEPWGCGFDPWPCSVDWGSGVAVSYGVGCSHRLVATALISPLAWEPPYAAGAALKSKINR